MINICPHFTQIYTRVWSVEIPHFWTQRGGESQNYLCPQKTKAIT